MNTNDLPLFARKADHQTSHEAMAILDRRKLGAASQAIVAMLNQYGPLPDYRQRELFPRFFTEPCCAHLYRQARSVARDLGFVKDTGQVVKNPETGRKQTLWMACHEPPVNVRTCPTCGHVIRDEPHKSNAGRTCDAPRETP